ncbi:MAG: hypothetical protein Fur0041_07830 [Bacteroidia bacterium]
MSAFFSILILLVCIFLVIAVLIQNPKGGGLASGFSTGNQMMGVRRTADFLEKATWTLAVLLVILSIASTSMNKRGMDGGAPTETSTTKDKAADFDNKPAAPVTTPAPAPAPQKP